MRVSYKGMDKGYNYRIAEIGYNENELERLWEIVDTMESKGWKIDVVGDGYALCEVDDIDDYKEFMNDWKETKKETK